MPSRSARRSARSALMLAEQVLKGRDIGAVRMAALLGLPELLRVAEAAPGSERPAPPPGRRQGRAAPLHRRTGHLRARDHLTGMRLAAPVGLDGRTLWSTFPTYGGARVRLPRDRAWPRHPVRRRSLAARWAPSASMPFSATHWPRRMSASRLTSSDTLVCLKTARGGYRRSTGLCGYRRCRRRDRWPPPSQMALPRCHEARPPRGSRIPAAETGSDR